MFIIKKGIKMENVKTDVYQLLSEEELEIIGEMNIDEALFNATYNITETIKILEFFQIKAFTPELVKIASAITNVVENAHKMDKEKQKIKIENTLTDTEMNDIFSEIENASIK